MPVWPATTIFPSGWIATSLAYSWAAPKSVSRQPSGDQLVSGDAVERAVAGDGEIEVAGRPGDPGDDDLVVGLDRDGLGLLDAAAGAGQPAVAREAVS